VLEIAENAKLSGHKNHAQKILYVERLKEQLINADKVCHHNSVTVVTIPAPMACSSHTTTLTILSSPQRQNKSDLTLLGEREMEVKFQKGNENELNSENMHQLSVSYDENAMPQRCINTLSCSQLYGDLVHQSVSPQRSVFPSNKWNISVSSFQPVVSTPKWRSRRESAATIYMSCRSQMYESDAVDVETETSSSHLARLFNADQTLAISEEHANVERLKTEWWLADVARSRARRIIGKAVEKRHSSGSVSNRSQADDDDDDVWPSRLSFSRKRDVEQP